MKSFSLCFRVWSKDANSVFHHEIQTVGCAASLKCTPLAVYFVGSADEGTGFVLETPSTVV